VKSLQRVPPLEHGNGMGGRALPFENASSGAGRKPGCCRKPDQAV
jgi:hypothetical protein